MNQRSPGYMSHALLLNNALAQILCYRRRPRRTSTFGHVNNRVFSDGFLTCVPDVRNMLVKTAIHRQNKGAIRCMALFQTSYKRSRPLLYGILISQKQMKTMISTTQVKEYFVIFSDSCNQLRILPK